MSSSQILSNHFLELAFAFKVVVTFDPTISWIHSTAVLGDRPDSKMVIVAPILCESSYAAALHELGHLLALNGMSEERQRMDRPLYRLRDSRYAELQRIEEEAAWEWAQHYALYWSEAMESVKTWAFSTYRR